MRLAGWQANTGRGKGNFDLIHIQISRTTHTYTTLRVSDLQALFSWSHNGLGHHGVTAGSKVLFLGRRGNSL